MENGKYDRDVHYSMESLPVLSHFSDHPLVRSEEEGEGAQECDHP